MGAGTRILSPSCPSYRLVTRSQIGPSSTFFVHADTPTTRTLRGVAAFAVTLSETTDEPRPGGDLECQAMLLSLDATGVSSLRL